MKVALYGQVYHKTTKPYLKLIFDLAQSKNISLHIEADFHNQIQSDFPTLKDVNVFTSFNDIDKTIDIMLTIGGDGTILRAVTYIQNSGIPILGINTGRLGFLATIQKENITDTLLRLLKKEYQIKQRSLLQIRTEPKYENFEEFNFALNEITVSRKDTTSMIIVETHLNEEYLTSYWADGLIIATPTGSTGYSLSCGGPVITPEAENLVITPIAPHNLNARPLIISDQTKIRLNVQSREDKILVSLDSRLTTIDISTTLYIQKAPFCIKMLELNNQTFLKTLREKLLWGQDTRN